MDGGENFERFLNTSIERRINAIVGKGRKNCVQSKRQKTGIGTWFSPQFMRNTCLVYTREDNNLQRKGK